MIDLQNIGKRFRYEWIFKDISYQFQKGESYAILGANGSGKSTLMKILSGHLTPSVGAVNFYENTKKIDADAVYRHISYAAPYIELIEEFTLTEMIHFHQKFKSFHATTEGGVSQHFSIKDIIEILDFNKSAQKEIRFFSSGMKQRLKLALAICSDTPFLLLDEPTTNLDAQGVEWYQKLIDKFVKNTSRTLIVASNIEHDYIFCTQYLNVSDFK